VRLYARLAGLLTEAHACFAGRRKEQNALLAEKRRFLQSAEDCGFAGARAASEDAYGDVFRDADVVSIDELRAAREVAVVHDDDGEEEHTSR